MLPVCLKGRKKKSLSNLISFAFYPNQQTPIKRQFLDNSCYYLGIAALWRMRLGPCCAELGGSQHSATTSQSR